MADEENALGSSRKRVADREISKDNPDPDEDNPDLEHGLFERASEEVMATRRIVRVKRTQPGSASNASINPFSGVRLVSSSETSVNTSDKTEIESKGREADKSGVDGERVVGGERKEGGNEEKESDLVEGGEDRENAGGERKEAEEQKKTDEGEASDERENVRRERKEAEEQQKTDEREASEERENPGGERKEAEGPKKTDEREASEEREYVEGERKEAEEQQKTDEREASEERENAGGERKEAEEQNKTDEPSLFGSFHQLSSSQNAFSGFSATGSFTFGTSPGSGALSGSVPTNSSSSNKITMQETEVKTGEENEKSVFTADAILYEYLENAWKERGKGEIKLNLTTTGENKSRLVMRARGNYRLILNASVYADMALKEMDKRGITFVCVNSVGESQGQNGLSTFALKFRDVGVRDDFTMAVEMHKCKKDSED